MACAFDNELGIADFDLLHLLLLLQLLARADIVGVVLVDGVGLGVRHHQVVEALLVHVALVEKTLFADSLSTRVRLRTDADAVLVQNCPVFEESAGGLLLITI